MRELFWWLAGSACLGVCYYFGHVAYFGTPPRPLLLRSFLTENSKSAASPAERRAAKVEAALAEADKRSQRAVQARCRSVRETFATARRGCKSFAEEALGWEAKWALIRDTAGLSEGDAHATFLREALGRLVLQPDAVGRAVNAAVKGLVADLDAIENEMLVRLRADLDDRSLGRREPAVKLDEQALRREYRRAVEESLATAEKDAKVTVGREVVSFVAADFATDVAATVVMRVVAASAAEMGVSATVLGSGAASTIATLGVGLVVGIVVDQVIACLLQILGYDAQAKIASSVHSSLDRTESALLGGKGGLSAEFEKLHKNRSAARRAAVLSLTKENAK